MEAGRVEIEENMHVINGRIYKTSEKNLFFHFIFQFLIIKKKMAKSITVSSALKEYGNFFTVSYHGHKNEVGKAEESGVCLVIFDIDSKEESPNFQTNFRFFKRQ